jgi:hypothetical protein
VGVGGGAKWYLKKKTNPKSAHHEEKTI